MIFKNPLRYADKKEIDVDKLIMSFSLWDVMMPLINIISIIDGDNFLVKPYIPKESIPTEQFYSVHIYNNERKIYLSISEIYYDKTQKSFIRNTPTALIELEVDESRNNCKFNILFPILSDGANFPVKKLIASIINGDWNNGNTEYLHIAIKGI